MSSFWAEKINTNVTPRGVFPRPIKISSQIDFASRVPPRQPEAQFFDAFSAQGASRAFECTSRRSILRHFEFFGKKKIETLIFE